ncbi:hypothetical protein WSM22_05880 [Cytophagales bacterium WSM2-2]|nr:hypothetical protein WSM22_05880 [Cytophagales bacterium WSM2-2]
MKDSLIGKLEERILLIINELQIESKAYDLVIANELEKQSGRSLGLDLLYDTLTKMEKEGLITSELSEGGKRGRRLTDQGKDILGELTRSLPDL